MKKLDYSVVPTLDAFATKHNLKRSVISDSCEDKIIVLGKPPKPKPEQCSHIYELEPGRLAVCLLYQSARAWNSAKERLSKLGFEMLQDGDEEGSMSFDPVNPAQAKAAIKETRARKVKQLSQEHKAKLALRLNQRLRS